MEEIWNYFGEMRIFYEDTLHKYLENDDFQEELSGFWEKFPNIKYNKYKLKCALHIISQISNNHFRSVNFWYKIEQLILSIKDNIMSSFSEEEIFLLFINNKKMLLFLFQEKIIKPQYYMFTILCFFKKFANQKLAYFFFDEFQSFYQESLNAISAKLCRDQHFPNKKQNGENPFYLCELIRKDSINEFISYVNQKNVSIDSKITISIFETNSYLTEKEPNLIEYSAFYGSNQIFKYLYQMKADITPSLLLYAIHGNNYDIINFIENELDLTKENYLNCYKESVKCHHNELAQYYYEKCSEILTNEKNSVLLLDHYNFELITNFDYINIYDLLYHFCSYDYYIPAQKLLNFIDLTPKILNEKFYLLASVEKKNIDIVKLLLNHQKIDVNQKFPIKNSDKEFYHEKNALVEAAKNNCNEIFRLLLSQPKIDINKIEKLENFQYNVCFEKNALFYAVNNNNIEMTQLLVERKEIKINAILYNDLIDDTYRRTVLFEAVNKGNSEIVRILLHHPKINVNAQSKKFEGNKVYINTALSQAIKNNKIDIIKLLLNSKKIDVNLFSQTIDKKQKIKMSPFGLAVNLQNMDVIYLLLLNPKIDINKQCVITTKTESNSKTKEKRTPLQLAIENKNIDIIETLLHNDKTNPNLTFDSCEIKYHVRIVFTIYMILALIVAAGIIYDYKNGICTYTIFWSGTLNLIGSISIAYFPI